MKQSTFLSINLRDLAKGFIVTFTTAAITMVVKVMESGAFPSGAQFKSIAIVGLTGGLAYVLKNWLTNSEDKFLSGEQK